MISALAPIPISRPRLAGVNRDEAVSAAVDTVKRLGGLDPDEGVTLAAETEMAVLEVLQIADQMVLYLIDRATLKDLEARLFPGPERMSVRRRIVNLANAIAVQREQLRQIGARR